MCVCVCGCVSGVQYIDLSQIILDLKHTNNHQNRASNEENIKYIK